MRTPWPRRSAPQICTASQMDGRPKASPAWMVMWKLSSATVRKASRWRVGGWPASLPAMSKPTTPLSRWRRAASATSLELAAWRMAVTSRPISQRPSAVPRRNPSSMASMASSRVRPRSRHSSGAMRTSA